MSNNLIIVSTKNDNYKKLGVLNIEKYLNDPKKF